MRWNYDDAYPFGWDNFSDNKCYIGNAKRTHEEIRYDYNNNNEVPQGRQEFKFSGRLWTRNKIITFWKYPPKNKMAQRIKELNKEAKERKLDIKIDFNKWKIEIVVDKNGKYLEKFQSGYWDSPKYEGKSVIIPLGNYAGSAKRTKKDTGVSHMLSPVDKQINKIISKGKDMTDKEKKDAMDYYKYKDMKNHPDLYAHFLSTIDVSKLINEITKGDTAGLDVDDGPSTYYKKFDHYKKNTLNKFLMHGWKIMDYIIGNGIENNIDGGHTIGVTYFPAGVVGQRTPTNYKDLKGKAATSAWLKDIKKTALQLGWEFLNWKDNIEALKQAEKSSGEDFKQEKDTEKKMKVALSVYKIKESLIPKLISGALDFIKEKEK